MKDEIVRVSQTTRYYSEFYAWAKFKNVHVPKRAANKRGESALHLLNTQGDEKLTTECWPGRFGPKGAYPTITNTNCRWRWNKRHIWFKNHTTGPQHIL